MEKNNFKIAVKIFTPIILIALSIFFMSYGNIKNYPSINDFIVELFLKKGSSKSLSSDFKNYKFEFKKGSLKGNYISKTGLFNHASLNQIAKDPYLMTGLINLANSTIEEEWGGKTPKDWIVHGGFSADEPEVPASLRHFYHPTRSEGERYLSDAVNSKLLNVIQSDIFGNPKTNGVEWALGTKGPVSDTRHIYTWKYGKEFMKNALEEADIENRNKFMAKSWRALGETLHMIADNGCPVHVRNDAHPSIPYLSYFGNPDFYEEDMALRKDLISVFNTGNVSNSLKSKFEKEKTVESIAHELAIFTNNNFFTTETISGTDWKGNNIKQITHPDYEYSNPKLSSGNYEKNYYRTTINGVQGEVLLATDTWFFMKYPISKTYPYINEEVVTSQANVLIPAIVEAGANVIKLFIPKLKIIISTVSEDGSITGEIIHKTDQEYKDKIYYNGPVEIMRNKVSKLTSFNAKNGKFTGKIEVKEKTVANAAIEFGGITVYSDDFIIDVKKKDDDLKDADLQDNKTSKKLAWVLTEVKTNDWQSKMQKWNAKNTSWRKDAQASENSATFKTTFIGKNDSYVWVKNGMSESGQVSWTKPSKSIILANEEVSLNLTAAHLGRDHDNFRGIGFVLAQHFSIDEKGNAIGSASYFLNKDGKSSFGSSSSNNYQSQSATVTSKIESGRNLGDKEVIRVSASNGNFTVETWYIYVWKEI